MQYFASLFLLGLALMVVALSAWIAGKYGKPKIIFTCTTFFDFPKQDRWKIFKHSLKSFYKVHTPATLSRIDKWVVVNEYSPQPRENWAKLMAEEFPEVEFIQKKDATQKGQAASLNMILDKIKDYDYWLQWEDAWFCDRAFINRAIDVLDHSEISQLQLTKLNGKVNWLNTAPKNQRHRWAGTTKYIQILQQPVMFQYADRSPYEMSTKDSKWINAWPLFSLLPSLNRVRDYVNLGKFSQDPELWPIRFEWDFARRWLKNGNTKAVLPDGPAIRSQGHVSTYS